MTNLKFPALAALARTGALFAFLVVGLFMPQALRPADSPRERVVQIVAKIQRADYQDERTQLKSLYDTLTPFLENRELAPKVNYWRGFALWRRAINGFNDHVKPEELQNDLSQAIEDFRQVAHDDPVSIEARIGILSCDGFLAYSLSQQDPKNPRSAEVIKDSIQLRKEVEANAPNNPRFLWVEGPIYWNVPPERGGGQPKAFEAYEKGLESIRTHKPTTPDPLIPSWGEPELLMSVAWSDLNKSQPDLDAAEENAESALKIVPDWHYVRDILLQQIKDARKKTGPAQKQERPWHCATALLKSFWV